MVATPLLHVSDRDDIERFEPHVPTTNPDQPPLVWAIDRVHVPAYWFARDCPRACWWQPGGERIHAIERGWAATLDVTDLVEYELPPATFERWPDAHGYHVSEVAVEPLARRRLPTPRALHEAAGIELRVVDDLWPVIDSVVAEQAYFSILRKGNLDPRR